jgi:hypothetical protein
MEELQTVSVDVPLHGRTITVQLKEKDFGDYIVYDVYSSDMYLFTISKKGDILFNEADNNPQQEIIDPRQLNEIAEYLREKAGLDIQ